MLKRKQFQNDDSEQTSESESEMLSSDEKDASFQNKAKNKKICLIDDSEDESAMSKDISNEKDIKSQEVSSDEQKSVSKSIKTYKRKKDLSEEEAISSSSSDDEPEVVKSKISSKQNNNETELEADGYALSSEEEPLSKIAKSNKLPKRFEKEVISSSSSDDEPIIVKSKISSKQNSNENNEALLEADGYALSSEEEPLCNITRTGKLTKKFEKEVISSHSSDDEPEVVKSKISSKRNNDENTETELEADGYALSSEEEPLSKIARTGKLTEKCEKEVISSSSSDDEPEVVKSKISSKRNNNENNETVLEADGHALSSEEEPLSKIARTDKRTKKFKKEAIPYSSSDDELLAVKSNISSKLSKFKTQRSKLEESGNSLSSDEENEKKSKHTKTSNTKGKSKKAQNSSNGRIEHIKKYLRVAGIHIQSYDKLFEDCKSVKSKVEKLLMILHEKGLKGRPTLEKCKKLKKKIETKKEIAELDTSNIIKIKGRPKRGINRASQNTKCIENSPSEKRFARLRDIIDSEESD